MGEVSTPAQKAFFCEKVLISPSAQQITTFQETFKIDLGKTVGSQQIVRSMRKFLSRTKKLSFWFLRPNYKLETISSVSISFVFFPAQIKLPAQVESVNKVLHVSTKSPQAVKIDILACTSLFCALYTCSIHQKKMM